MYFLPGWSKEELDILRQGQYPRVPENRLHALMQLWGGNPRWVLAKALDPGNEGRHAHAVRALDLAMLNREARIWSGGRKSGEGAVLRETESVTQASLEVKHRPINSRLRLVLNIASLYGLQLYSQCRGLARIV